VVIGASAGAAALLQLDVLPGYVRRVIVLSPVSVDSHVPQSNEEQDWVAINCDDESRASSIRRLTQRLPPARTRIVELPACVAHAQHIFASPAGPVLIDTIQSALHVESG